MTAEEPEIGDSFSDENACDEARACARPGEECDRYGWPCPPMGWLPPEGSNPLRIKIC
jgi:hypothetical protein